MGRLPEIRRQQALRAVLRSAVPVPRRSTHRSTVELERAIRDYLAANNRNPKPFVWTKTADQILESIKRFCVRTADSGH